MTTPARVARNPGVVAAAGLGLVLLAFAATIDLPRVSQGFKGDEATYYSLTKSLATDFDFSFERRDLTRVWEEFRGGPEGIFLKRGKVNRVAGSSSFPFVRRVKLEDPVRTRLYYAKSFIYPLAAAPFVWLFGTHGFLVLHALLLTLDVYVAYLFLTARGSSRVIAAAYALVFFAASVVPVYFVWLTPELFNVSLVLYAMFLWCYKEMVEEPAGVPRFLLDARSDYLAAALIGVLTFSKPPHAILLFPIIALVAARREWARAAAILALAVVLAGGLFVANAAITGEFNYQAGDRKTFYGRDGFPFANNRETFESIGPVRERGSVMVGDVLANRHTFTVLRHDLVYFLIGRFCGLVPYFFPGVLSTVFFFTAKQRAWQWLVLATIAGAALALLVVTPFTYSGGGAPVGNRYFLSFYPLFLFLTPPLSGLMAPGLALTGGAIFTAQILMNPLYASFHPGDHAKTGPLHMLPIELTLLNDLPMAFDAERSRRPLEGSPPMLAYFPDDGAFTPEGDGFWLRGKSRTDVILRAPVADTGGGQFLSKTITSLAVELQNGGDPDRVTVSSGAESRTFTMKPAEVVRFRLTMPDGVPYHRDENPTSYLYVLSFRTTAGFVPFLDAPGSSDSRFLGAHVKLTPEYADAETTAWKPRN